MFVTMGIGTLLLGGWVLNSAADGFNQIQFLPPANNGEPILFLLPPSHILITPLSHRRGNRSMLPQQPQTMQQQQQQQQQQQCSHMPVVPMEAVPPGMPGTPGMLPPTQPIAGPSGRLLPVWGWPYGPTSTMPMTPTYRRPTQMPPGYASNAANAFEQQRSQLMAAMAPQKAYADYQGPSSGVSAWMNLYRSGTSNGTIDNYTTLVRPSLQQQNANQQFGNDIFGLQRNTRIQELPFGRCAPAREACRAWGRRSST